MRLRTLPAGASVTLTVEVGGEPRQVVLRLTDQI
jgi:hypothetical protein